MKRMILLASVLIGIPSRVLAEGHDSSAGVAEATPATELSPSVRSLMRPKHRQKILGSRAAAEESAKASCLSLLADRQDPSFYGFWASPAREQRKVFPDDLGRFAQRHAENSIECARVSMEAGYLVSDRERLSTIQANPSASVLLGIIALPLAITAAATEDLRLADGEWAAISQVRMTCEARPESERLILRRARECGELQHDIDRSRDPERRRALEESRPTYCDGIVNAARDIRATEFVRVGDEACVEQ